MVTVVTPEQFASILDTEDRPVLAGCLQRDSSFMEQCMVLQAASTAVEGKARVCLMDPDWLNEFCRKFSISGTPSYLLFNGGTEYERFLGRAELHNLTAMARRLLPAARHPEAQGRQAPRFDMELSRAGYWS